MRFIKLDVPFVFAKGGCGSGMSECGLYLSNSRASITHPYLYPTYRVSNKSITRSLGTEGGSGGGGGSRYTNAHAHEYIRSSIWRLHEGSLGCASISVMTSKPRGHAIAPFRGRRVVSFLRLFSQRPSSKAVFSTNVSRAISIFVFATFLRDERARMEVFVFVPDHSYTHTLSGRQILILRASFLILVKHVRDQT